MEQDEEALSKSSRWGMDLLMILVTLGTQDKGFERLLKIIDKKIDEGIIQEEVIVQAGYTKYESKNMKIFDLVSNEKLEKLVKKCRILITHGGVGSILMGIEYNKPTIAVARLKKYREHTNDHQRQIIREFEKQGYLLALRDFQKFDKVFEKAEHFKPKKFVSNTQKFVENIENYIDNTHHTSWWNRVRFFASNGYCGLVLTIFYILISYFFLSQNISWYFSIILSTIVVSLLEVIFHFINDIKPQGKKFILTKAFVFLLEIGVLYLLIEKLDMNIYLSIGMASFISLLSSFGFIRFLNRGK